MKKRLLTIVTAFFLSMVMFSGEVISAFATTDEDSTNGSSSSSTSTAYNSMSDKQLSSLSMLNYITVLSKEINASSNSKVYLDNAYSDIVNNVNPNAVDEDTMSEIKQLLNTIYAYQSIETKRERLEYMYEQNQANAIQKALPNPMSILNIVQSGDPLKAVLSVVYMAVDAKTSYTSYLSEVENKYLENGWALDDEAAGNLHESRKEAFSYMVEMCQKHGLDGNLALNEKSVDNFVSWENNSNTTRKIDFFEQNEKTYQAYGKYWLVLAECYYDQGEYAKCISSIDKYKSMKIDTFRKDHDLAKALSIALDAARHEYSGSAYEIIANRYLSEMLNNIEIEDWAIKYLAAQAYMDLYAKTTDEDYLQKAYDLIKQNVNLLIDEQQKKNKEYLEDVVKQTEKKTDSKARKKEIKDYNKWLEEERKVELPPVYQPLVVNCELLFGLAGQLKISESEKKKINNMLHSGDSPLFLVSPLEELYWFDHATDEKTVDVKFNGKSVEIPAEYLSLGTNIKVVISDNGTETIYEDWNLSEVERGTKGKIDTFKGVYTSKSIKKQKYSNGMVAKIIITPSSESTYKGSEYKFEAKVSKKAFVLDDVTFTMVK